LNWFIRSLVSVAHSIALHVICLVTVKPDTIWGIGQIIEQVSQLIAPEICSVVSSEVNKCGIAGPNLACELSNLVVIEVGSSRFDKDISVETFLVSWIVFNFRKSLSNSSIYNWDELNFVGCFQVVQIST